MMPTTRKTTVLLLLLGGLCSLQAATGLDRDISLNIWRDRPSEALHEVNVRLPPADRLAWYVVPATDEGVYPGPVVEVDNKPARGVIDAYCKAVGLSWRSGPGNIWVFRPLADASAVDAADAQLSGADSAAKELGAQALAAIGTPDSVGRLLRHWATGDAATKAAARRGFGIFLGASRSQLGNPKELAYALWGHPDSSRRRHAPLLDRDALHMPAPWAAVQVLLAEDGLVALVEQILADHPRLQADTVALSLGILAGSEAVREPLGAWCVEPSKTGGFNGGGWEERYIRSRAQGHFKTAFPEAEMPRPEEKRKKRSKKDDKDGEQGDPPHPAVAIRDAILADNVQAMFDKARIDGDALNREVRTARANNNAGAMKELRKRQKDLENLQKRANDELRKQMRAIGELADLNGDEKTISVLVQLITDREQVYDLLRETAAQAAESHRDERLVPALIDCIRNDDQPRAQSAAARSLGAQRHPDGQAALDEFLANDANAGMRRNAVRGLARARHPDSADAIIGRLDKAEDAKERQFILQYLGVLRDPEANQLLTRIMQDESASLPDRLSAAVSLTRVPTEAAREALATLLRDEPNVALKQQVLEGMRPGTLEDVEQFGPVLLQVAATEREPALLEIAVTNLQYCARMVGSGHPIKDQVRDSSLAIVEDMEQANNVRKLCLNSFKYVDVDQALADALAAVVEAEQNPIMKRFARIAHKQVVDRLTQDEQPAE